MPIQPLKRAEVWFKNKCHVFQVGLFYGWIVGYHWSRLCPWAVQARCSKTQNVTTQVDLGCPQICGPNPAYSWWALPWVHSAGPGRKPNTGRYFLYLLIEEGRRKTIKSLDFHQSDFTFDVFYFIHYWPSEIRINLILYVVRLLWESHFSFFILSHK